jgi:hypothetical protein
MEMTEMGDFHQLLAKRSQISMHLRGGLGNQLFIYSAGVLFAIRAKSGLRIFSHGIDHGECISDLSLPGNFKNFSSNSSSLKNLAAKFNHKWIQRSSSLQDFSDQIGYGVTNLNLVNNEKLYVKGFFQNKVYPETLAEKGFEFQFPEHLNTNWIKKTRFEISSSKSVLIHLRLGDYLNSPLIFGLLAVDYYEKVLLENNLLNHRIYVISDDNRLAEYFFGLSNLIKPEFINPPRGVSNLSLLGLFSSAHVLIISNSSYSWWGAWLAGPEVKVIAPYPWFRDEIMQKQVEGTLIPESWNVSESIWRD